MMFLIRTMVIVASMINDSDQSVLSSRFWVFERLEPELVVDLSWKQNMIQKMVFYLFLSHVHLVWIEWKILMLWQNEGKR